jgi:hypothetical protein
VLICNQGTGENQSTHPDFLIISPSGIPNHKQATGATFFSEKGDNPRPLHQHDAHSHILLRLQYPAAEQHRPRNKAKTKPEAAYLATVTSPDNH